MTGFAVQSRVCVIALVLCAVPLSLAAQTPLALRASAGVGGLVKAGRWAPVRLEIDNAGADTTATVIVTWGDAVVEQPVTIVASTRRVFDFFVRTADPDSTIRIAVEDAKGDVVHTRDISVTVLPAGTQLTVCVADIDDASPPGCSATLTGAQLPTSPRGYDAVDQVITVEGMRVAREARSALQQWESLRALDMAGDLSLTPQPTRPVVARGLPSGLSVAVVNVFGAYVAALVLVGFVAAGLRYAAWSSWTAFALVLVLGTAASVAVGRVGPGREVVVHHTSLLQQIPGTSASALLMRGVAEFPTEGAISLSLPTQDGMLEITQARGRGAHLQDESGQPLLRSTHGLGARQAFTAEAIVALQWASVSIQDNVIQVQNVSPHVLERCRFAEGVTPPDVGELAPGSTITAVRHGDYGGPLFTCSATVPALSLRGSQQPVTMRGSTQLAVYAPRDAARNIKGEPND